MANQNWIKIESSVFKTAKYEDIVFLTQIFQWSPLNSIPRYNYFVDIISYSDIEQFDNFKKLPEINRKFIKEQFVKAVQSGKRNNYNYLITNGSHRGNNEFTLQKAIRFFLTPVSIVLENSLNDSYFLNSIFNHFDDKSNGKLTLMEYLKNGWIHYVNAGGWTNVENYINGIIHSLSDFTTNPNKYIRCFVLVDSDRQYENYDITSKHDLRDRLEQKGVRFHILNKRAMENYMPDQMIYELAKLSFLTKNKKKHQDWIDVYTYLVSKQKDYLNYQKGFPKEEDTKNNKKRNLQSMPIQELYTSVVKPDLNIISDSNYEILDNGLKEFPKFKDEFPKLFQDSRYVYRKSLLEREGGTDNENEFQEIIQKINSLL